MSVKLNLIAAACENMGIGKNGDLPWRLRTEMEYFTRMTSKTNDNGKKNIVLMGRKTWDSVPQKFKPFSNRINFVLSRKQMDFSNDSNVFSFTSLEKAIEKLNDNKFKEEYEKVWVIGGSHIYKATMDSQYFYRLYLTEIKKHFECDTFMPPLGDNLKEVSDAEVPQDIQREKDVEFLYKIYENVNYKK